MNEIESLLEQVKNGDETALGRLFATYQDRLGRMVALRLDVRLAGRVDADDILQEAYLAARKRLHHYLDDPSRSFFVWLRLVTMQTMVDVHRRHLGARMRTAGLEVSATGSPQAATATLSRKFVGDLTSPSQAAIRSEMRTRLEEALDGMAAIDREILTMRHFEELSNNEVAEILGLTKSATSNRYVRALTRLRGIMSGLSDFRDEGHDAT